MNPGLPLTSTPTELPAATRRRLANLFTREEIAALTARSDLRGLWAIASSWAIVAAAFALVAWRANVLTVLLALALIAGRQLAFGILQHEGAHGTLFRTRWMNDWFCDWLCARPVWQHLHKYRLHHLRHHTLTGTDEDPDKSLHAGYPVSRASMARKLLRDIIGITGLKLLLGLVLMDAGVLRWTVASAVEKLPQDGRRWWDYPSDFLRNAGGMLLTNGLLFGILAACGHPALYLLWISAYVTPFPLFLRIRSIAEHGVLPRVPDMFQNTRSMRAGWLARLFVAPVNVNYHIEHHAMASVPCYRLPLLHRWLRDKGVVPAPPTYLQVLGMAAAETRP